MTEQIKEQEISNDISSVTYLLIMQMIARKEKGIVRTQELD